MRNYLGMQGDDLAAKPYARFWQPAMTPLSPASRQALERGPESADYGFPSSDLSLYAATRECFQRTGYTRLRNQQLFVTVHTAMPGVTGAMLDWWFGWHGAEAQRYKLWHPQSHVAVRMRDDRSSAATLSDRDRYLGNAAFVTEYIGRTKFYLNISFVPPSAFGLTPERCSVGQVTAAVAAHVGYGVVPLRFGKLLHLLREGSGGGELQSYFWLGDLAALTPVLAPLVVSKQKASDLLRHCAEEMQHLASFLPALYALYHRA